MNVLQYLNTLRPAIPMSMEKPCTVMSNGELRRHIVQGGVLINHHAVTPTEELDYPILSVVFFPNSRKKRTTLM